MKAILIVCLILASIFFIPSSNAAEEKCNPYIGGCRSKPPAQPLKPVAPPLKPPTPPTPGPPYRRPSPPFNRPPRSGCNRYNRCPPSTP
ncbi:hypothetical protein RGQ29_011325 [Quercus rubra]|uniref:Uncharacterized protein n=1 Tax=Quercus rubra TaxID=3512 RepID=A0AAN7J8L3_QUERU|nr:hypothetical protein RGQ29_011325 [Quercus rubra]